MEYSLLILNAEKTVMAEDIYALSLVQLEFFVLGYCVTSFIGGQNLGTALWSHLQGSIAQRPFLDIDAMSKGTEKKAMADQSLCFLRLLQTELQTIPLRNYRFRFQWLQ